MPILPDLERWFPKLAAAGYEKTSDETGYPPRDGSYNCIAWAAHDSHHFIWPQVDAEWPFWSPRIVTRQAFIRAFRGLGYRVCYRSHPEFWFDKVVLYEDASRPKHMARQLRDGTWTSKCGGSEDITHFTLDAIESPGNYGSPEIYMKRFLVVSWLIRLCQWFEWKVESVWPYVGFLVWRKRQ